MAKLAASLLAILAVCTVAPSAGAQVMDGIAHCQWLKLKAKATGVELNEDSLGPKRSVSATCYMQLVFLAPDAGNPHGRYGAPLLCQVNAADWEASASPGEAYEGMALGDGNAVSIDDYLTLKNAAGDVIQGYTSNRLTITVDKAGAFRSASFLTYSGELLDGSSYSLTPALLFGGYTVKGSSLPEAKVPAEARALVAGGVCPPATP
jgi:hypothetical protein